MYVDLKKVRKNCVSYILVFVFFYFILKSIIKNVDVMFLVIVRN